MVAIATLWQRLDEDHDARPLVAREAAPDERDEFIGRRHNVGDRDADGLDGLTPLRIGNTASSSPNRISSSVGGGAGVGGIFLLLISGPRRRRW